MAKKGTGTVEFDVSSLAISQNLSPGDLLFNMRWNIYLAKGTPLYELRIDELKSFVESHPKVQIDDTYQQEILLAYEMIEDPKDKIRLLRTPGGNLKDVNKIKAVDYDKIITAIDAVCSRHSLTWTSVPTEVL
jgi:hypothetical protein